LIQVKGKMESIQPHNTIKGRKCLMSKQPWFATCATSTMSAR
jgi:hypothetical protein